FAHAVLFAEHGGAETDRAAALAAVAKPNVRTAHADLAAVVDFLTAEPTQQAAARQTLLGATTEGTAALTQAGKVLLADKKLDDAFKKLSKAVELSPKNVRALVLLGEYYLEFEDYENALMVLGGLAEQRSPAHPQRVLGMSQARLELGRDVNLALTELESLPKNAAIPAPFAARYALLLGRAQAVNGKHDDALKTLTDGLAAHAQQRFEFTMGLGHAYRLAGAMEKAQKSFEDALKLEPKREDAKEALGRVLLARSREKELLERLKPETDGKKVALVRGIAFTRINDFKRARLELAKTQVGGKYPAEAAVYLAIADAAEEQGDKPVLLLEKLATQTKRHKATVQVALARVYIQRNQLDKARTQLEEAAKDGADYEANTQLGELLLNAGLPFDVALEPLQRAVDRNGSHAPARHLLARTYLSMGRFPDAMKQVEVWTTDNPGSELAWRDMAFVQFRTGHAKEAEAALAKGLRADSDDIEGWRLKAQVLFARGDARAAFAALERANKLNPKDPETFCEIGNAYVRQGNLDVAPKAYEAARREDAKSLCGGVGPFHAKPGAKSKPPAREEVTRLVKNAVDAWDKGFAMATLARVLLEERDVKGALSTAQEATTVAPGAATAWFALAEVARRTKNDAKAFEAYAKTTELDASWSTARLAYADALLKQGGDSLPKAMAEYQAVLGLSQNEGDSTRAKKAVAALKKQLR
ncbi:MAG: tetratricopeptide repeat protein, partial [Archangium sp.]|nr:tetratricopeptide repeat protein [Archangium sp.]